MKHPLALGCVLALAGCPSNQGTSELRLGKPSTLLHDTEGGMATRVQVVIPVLAIPGGASLKLLRDGAPVAAAASPSSTLPGGTDYIDVGASFSPRIGYQVQATYADGRTLEKNLSFGLVRTLGGMPRLGEPVAGANLQGNRPIFRWDTQGLGAARLRLEVTPQSGQAFALLFDSRTDRYAWGDRASVSANVAIAPGRLPQGIPVAARVTAIAGPFDRTDSSGLQFASTEQAESRSVTFTP